MKKIGKSLLAPVTAACLMTSCIEATSFTAADGQRLWSDIPAFTCVMENERELCGTSDVYDNIHEGMARPVLPRVAHPSNEVKRWDIGEGTEYLNEETYATTGGRYNNPVRIWEAEAYSMGNGRIGVSAFHGSGRDRYAINESSYWSGGRNGGTINQKGDKSFDGEQGPDATDDEFGGDQPVGDLIVDFGAPLQEGSFIREIIFDKGELHSAGVRKGVRIESRALTSYADQVIALKYTADTKSSLNALITMALQRESDMVQTDSASITMHSRLKNGMECMARTVIRNHGGSLRQETDGIYVVNADSCDLIVSVETNYHMDYESGFRGKDPAVKVKERLSAVDELSFEDIEDRHLADYQELYGRSSLILPAVSSSTMALPTYQRLENYKKTCNDTGLEQTIFNYGKYLMISTSRPGSLPGGLQGVWNGMTTAPWGNDYHSNINMQMVYWLPEVANLGECHSGLIDYLYAMRKPNRLATQEYLDALGETDCKSDGWVVYTSHNPFGGHGWQVNLPGSAWYGLHIWEHYAFNEDEAYLKEKAYPMLKELSAYWMQHLKALKKGGEGFVSNYETVDVSLYPELADIEEGTLVVPLGWSPEHGPRGEDGVAHDQEIILELFQNTIKAAQELDTDKEFADSLSLICQKMYFPRIGKRGNLMEWMIDRDPVTEHRHTSHLFGVYPGSTITPLRTPELAEAARQSLLFRKNIGDSRRSWAWTWRAMIWSRLHDGEKAHEMIEGLICHNMLDNLFTTHKIPLQIDGNYGIAAAMIEMLVQSHEDVIVLLPSPCSAWPSGRLTGIKARGNIVVDMEWKDGKVTDYRLSSDTGKEVSVIVNGKKEIIKTEVLSH